MWKNIQWFGSRITWIIYSEDIQIFEQVFEKKNSHSTKLCEENTNHVCINKTCKEYLFLQYYNVSYRMLEFFLHIINI